MVVCSSVWQSTGELLGPENFRVGGSVLLNGLLLHIYDCDAFTRGHMPDQPAPTPVPTGEYLTPRFEGVSSNPRNSGTPPFTFHFTSCDLPLLPTPWPVV